jgi:polar amino acid transport system substrate-binding protein
MATDTGSNPSDGVRRAVLRAGAAALLAGGVAARAAPPGPLLLGHVDAEGSYLARWHRLVYGEAFKRLGVGFELVSYPTQRIGAMLDQGVIDGEVARARIYADAHPELIRVDESVLDISFALFATQPALELKRLDEVVARRLRVSYRRGVLFCEKALAGMVPASQLADVTQVEQGLMMLRTGRADLYCDVDAAIGNAIGAPELKGMVNVRKVLVLESAPLYPFLHRRHAELAPRLAAILAAMKAEGLLERYRLQAVQESRR